MEFFKKKEEFKPRYFPFEAGKRVREKRESKGDRKWVFGLLLGSIILSLGFWLWGRLLESGWKGATSPATLVSSLSPAPISRKTEEVIGEISNSVKNLKGDYGVYVFNLTTKQSYGILTDEVFPAASLIKLPVILTLYQELENGRINFESKYPLKQEDKQAGAGSMQYKPAGTVYTYRQMVELMAKQSDNTAFAVFRKILGDTKIQTTIDTLGMAKTSLVKNETSPEDIGLFFRKLYGGSIVSPKHRDEILSFLTETAFEDRIPAGVPTETRVAHKIGNEIGVFSDAGIVFAERPFVLVIMSKNALEKEAKETLPKITAAVWEFETIP